MINFPPKSILFAFDPSDRSRTAWRHAAALGARSGAVLEAVYVNPWESSLGAPPAAIPSQVRALRAQIRAVVGKGPKITILQGDPAHRILGLANRLRPDLLVVGTHGRTGLKRAILGSVAEAVVRGAEIPVLVARGPAVPVRSVLAPVNFTPYSDYGFDCAAAAAGALSARLTALYVTGDPIWDGNPRFRLSGLIARLPAAIRKSCRPMAQEAVGDVVKGILGAGKGHDWIVLVAHDKSLIKDALFGTTIEQVLRRSPIPVLSVPAAKVRARKRSAVTLI